MPTGAKNYVYEFASIDGKYHATAVQDSRVKYVICVAIKTSNGNITFSSYVQFFIRLSYSHVKDIFFFAYALRVAPGSSLYHTQHLFSIQNTTIPFLMLGVAMHRGSQPPPQIRIPIVIPILANEDYEETVIAQGTVQFI